MITTADLIEFVRRNLSDYHINDDSVVGEFWHEREILLALNVAQDVFVNFSLNNKRYDVLRHLHANTGAVAAGDLISGLTPTYLHYDAAKVTDDSDPPALRTARVYIGGETEIYNIIKHRSLCVINDDYYFNHDRDLSEGIMYYFKRPERITLTPATSRNADFDDYVYRDIICKYAAVLLGIKSIPTLREAYWQKGFYTNLGLQPPFAVLFLNNVEVKIRPGNRSGGQDGEQQSEG